MSEAKRTKQPSFILEQEITGKSGKVFTSRVGAMFEREDGTHGVKLDCVPLVGDLVARTPQQRLEQMKARADQPNTQEAQKETQQDIDR